MPYAIRMLSNHFDVLSPSATPIRSLNGNASKRMRSEGPARWYNKIEVVKDSGVFTEPFDVEFNGDAFFGFLGIPLTSLSGKRVLDIGAFDGALTFFAEDCGAEVIAIDIMSPKSTGFALIHELRGSSSTHVQCSIYDLHPDLFGKFDFVLFSGVHYHLRHPLLALERINSVMNDCGTLVALGTVSDFWLHSRSDERIGIDISKETKREIPICGFYRDKFMDDRSNWFIPNTVCLEDWLNTCGFEIGFSQTSPLPHRLNIKEGSRGCASIRAKKVGLPDTEYDLSVYGHLRTKEDSENTIQNLIPTRFEVYRRS